MSKKKKKRLSKNKESFIYYIIEEKMTASEAYLRSYKSAENLPKNKLLEEGVKLLKELEDEIKEREELITLNKKYKFKDKADIKERLDRLINSAEESISTFGLNKDNSRVYLEALDLYNKLDGNYKEVELKERELSLKYGLADEEDNEQVILNNDILLDEEMLKASKKERIDIFNKGDVDEG